MAQSSGIEWTDATWNPVAGCTPVSPGCLNCYAARMALRLSMIPGASARKYGKTAKRARDGRPVFTGEIKLDRESLDVPKHWRLPRTIFVNSMSDLFHEAVPTKYIQEVFEVMYECPQHIFQILTKRPARALEVAKKLDWKKNIWMGVSVETTKYYDRIRALQQIPAAVRFLSCEPLLGPLPELPLDGVKWVIVGGESGPGARPISEDWVREIRDQCEESDAAFFFKQWGGVRKHTTGRELDGRTWDAMPRSVA